MEFSIILIVYGFTFLIAMSILSILASFSALENLFFRVLAGGTIGTFTSNYLNGLTPFLSFLEACTNGDFSLGGYFCIVSFLTMLGVWAFNLFTTKEVIVR
jgi:hypothetical protein